MRTFIIGILVLVIVGGSGLAGMTEASPMRQQTDLVAGNNAFAFDLYHAISEENDNMIFSPYSISLALAMTYAGARGETEAQMAATLHFALPQTDLHPAFKALDSSLPRDTGDSAADDESFRLNVANALWGQDGYPFQADFINLLNENYGAGLELVNFMVDAEAARLRINDWVSEQTAGRIQDLIPQGAVDELTRLVLTNAIYFKAAWLSKFEAEITQDGPFTLLDGSSITVPLMSQTTMYGYTSGEGFQAVKLPYEGDQTAMVIFLPDRENFTAFEDTLNADLFASIIGGMVWKEVWLTMPRFEIESEFGLGDTLAALGMPAAFDPNLADFSGMADTDEPLYISAVIHKAFVKVDETGTEAAAATAVIMETTAAPAEPPVELRLDHPFIYAIYDQESGTILFLGRVLNPAE